MQFSIHVKKNLFALLLTFLATIASAQSFGYTEKTPLGNGFFKVKSGASYGLIDTTGKVIVSVEYHDIRFKEGRALLITGDNYRLYGYVDTLGHIREFDKEYYADPTYPYFSEGYLAVRNKKNKWGYISSDETPIKQKFAEAACRFDRAYPFSEGYATIYIRRKGWQHIDKSGKERFLLIPAQPAIYRTSVYKGECLIFTDEGIKQYQEAPSKEANVKITLCKAASGINWSALDEGRLTCQEGILYLDEMHRAEKFSNGIDSIVFIQPQLPEVRVPRMVEEKKDTFCLEKEIEIQIPQSTATATVKGWATFRIQISNRSESSSGEIEVEMSAGNTRDAWKGSLEAGSTKTINFSVPARISTPSITRNLTIVVRQKENKLETVQKITIRRYTPDNRR